MLSFVENTVAKLGTGPEKLIPILQAIQTAYRYLPEEALRHVCKITEIKAGDIEGVASFYSQFRRKPVGRHIISICHGTACHVKGAELIDDALRRRLKLDADEDTDADGVFTMQPVACLGCCTLAPVMQIDGITYGHLTAESVPRALEDFLQLEKRGFVQRTTPDSKDTNGNGLTEVRIGVGSCCVAGGSLKVREALEDAIQEIGAPAVVKPVGCVGMCHQTPLVEVVAGGQDGSPTQTSEYYSKVQPQDARDIILRHFKPNGVMGWIKMALGGAVDKLLTDEAWQPITRYSLDVRDAPVCAFLGPQIRIATEHSGEIAPLDIDEYIAHDGFAGLQRALGLGPQAVIETVTSSGLRGRGGAGFPSGIKWQRVREAQGEPKYIVMNGDEGDPGAFMDRMLLESYPYRVLEGIAIAALAVGALEGVLYIRAEYPLAVKRMREAIRICEERSYLGQNAGIRGIPLKLSIMEGAGAFVCGEETALLESIEGKRGMPRLKPPYPAQSGLWGMPTCINNVETYALVPWILRHGADEFSAMGTEKSKGAKVFALTGKVARGGLIEVPMGVTIRQIVEEIGGGTPDGRFKAVQIGGPSGGCIPAEMCDTPVDYEALGAIGAIMGSGGLVVLDDRDCMVDMARYFLDFTQRESCGKCTFCRLGTRRMLDLLEALCAGKGRKGDLEKLEELSGLVKNGSLCGLGQTAPNPVLSTLRYFRAEYEAHLAGKCPAGKCKALIKYTVNDDCIGCTRCAQECPVDAIPMTPYQKHTIDDALCTRCDTCRTICPTDAIKIV